MVTDLHGQSFEPQHEILHLSQQLLVRLEGDTPTQVVRILLQEIPFCIPPLLCQLVQSGKTYLRQLWQRLVQVFTQVVKNLSYHATSNVILVVFYPHVLLNAVDSSYQAVYHEEKNIEGLDTKEAIFPLALNLREYIGGGM